MTKSIESYWQRVKLFLEGDSTALSISEVEFLSEWINSENSPLMNGIPDISIPNHMQALSIRQLKTEARSAMIPNYGSLDVQSLRILLSSVTHHSEEESK